MFFHTILFLFYIYSQTNKKKERKTLSVPSEGSNRNLPPHNHNVVNVQYSDFYVLFQTKIIKKNKKEVWLYFYFYSRLYLRITHTLWGLMMLFKKTGMSFIWLFDGGLMLQHRNYLLHPLLFLLSFLLNKKEKKKHKNYFGDDVLKEKCIK